MDKAKKDRISELTRISGQRALTPSEQTEREALRREYIADFKQSLEMQLDNTYIVHTDGKKSKLRKKN